MEQRKITTRDIARETGVSQSAVSMILSQKKNVSFTEETREKVLKAAKKLGYVNPRKRKSVGIPSYKNTIFVMCPTLSSQYYTTLIESIAAYGEKYHLTTLTAHTKRMKETEIQYLSTFQDSHPAGIIFTYPPQNEQLINEIAKEVPVVLISDPNEKLKVNTIELHSKKPGKLIANHLLSLGHRQIAYLSTPLTRREIPRIQRLEGIKEAYVERGINTDFIVVKSISPQQMELFSPSRKYFDTGYFLTQEILKEDPAVTALIGVTDMMSMGIMEALAERGLRVPEDYSVCGFDNNFLSSFSSVSLTSVDHAVEYKGIDAVDMILNHTHTRLSKGSREPILRLEYESRLIVRKSTGLCRNRM